MNDPTVLKEPLYRFSIWFLSFKSHIKIGTVVRISRVQHFYPWLDLALVQVIINYQVSYNEYSHLPCWRFLVSLCCYFMQSHYSYIWRLCDNLYPTGSNTEEYVHISSACMSKYVLRAFSDECLGDIWLRVRVNVNCFFIILSAVSCFFFYHTWWGRISLKG